MTTSVPPCLRGESFARTPSDTRSATRAAAALLLVAAAGCSPFYVIKQGYGQAKVLLARRPVEDLSADPKTSDRTRAKLKLIAEVRQFGEARLGLARTQSYETYVDLEGRAVSYILTACPADSVEPKTWTFPIVGTVPYLGYFDPDDALAERDRLRKQGYDVSIRPASAYSTLGWFSDPVFSSFMDWPAHQLANTILHETTHATVWIPGEVSTNESFADIVGEEGALLFLAERFGPDSPELRAALHAREDQARFRAFILGLHADLKRTFALDIPRAEKIHMKAAVMDLHRRRFRTLTFHSPRYRTFPAQEWNNALVASQAVYGSGAPLWRAAYEGQGSDVRALIGFAEEAARQERPVEWIKARVR